jgi:hypothetical protein
MYSTQKEGKMLKKERFEDDAGCTSRYQKGFETHPVSFIVGTGSFPEAKWM